MSSFLKGSLLYFLGNSLSKVVAFFLLPIYSKYISPEDFGYFDVSQSYIYLIIPIVSLETYLSMMRFVKESQSDLQTGKIIFNGFAFLSLFLILVLFSLLIPFFFPEIKQFSLIITLLIVLMFQRYYTSICRGLGKNKIFVFTGIMSSFIVAISNYIMIVWYGMKLESMYWSAIFGFSYQILHIELAINIRKFIRLSAFDSQLLKQLLAFSFPLSVGSILYFFLNSYNRMIIESNMGLAVNGYFAIAAKFSLMITFITSAFTMAWQDYSFAPREDHDRKEVYSKGIDMYYKFLILGGALFVFVIAFVFPYLINDQYKDAYPLIALSIGVTLFSAIGDFLTQTFMALKKTRLILYSSLAITVICLILIPTSIQYLGVNGINLALILTYFLNMIFRLIYLHRVCQFRVNYSMYFGLLFYFIGVSWVFDLKIPLYNLFGFIATLLLMLFFFRGEVNTILIKFKMVRQK